MAAMAAFISVALLCWSMWLFSGLPVFGMTEVVPGAKVDAGPQILLELTSTFDRAEEAIRARDVVGLMALYSDKYRYHELKKPDIQKIWQELFAQYDLIANIHTFSAIKVIGTGPEAMVEITCTGALWANSKQTGERLSIDSWHQEVHHLVKEKGLWRIIGSAGGSPARPRMFGTAPHPLF
jgi:hypothetical protein